MIIKSNAKINLHLRITGKYETGLHSLSMINIPINLYDTLDINISEKGNQIGIVILNNLEIPTDENNLVHKVINRFKEINDINFNILIKIYKEIPTQSGTGGASSNAAEVIKYLNRYFDIDKDYDTLCKEYVDLGADIPFFIHNKPSIVKGIGDKVTNLELNLLKYYFVLIHPNNIKSSTREAYSQVTSFENDDTELAIKSIKKFDFSSLKNDFLKFQNNKYDKIINDLNDLGSEYTSLTGSGSTVFAIFRKEINSKKIANELSKKYRNVYICKQKGE